MDGGRRLLRSLREGLEGLVPARPAFASANHASVAAPRGPIAPPRRARAARKGVWTRAAALTTRRGFGTLLVFLLMGAVFGYAVARGGQYQIFVDQNGAPRDVLARALGFGIDAVTITGQGELSEPEVLALAGVGPRNSLIFLDAAQTRERLIAAPLIRNARVRKFYPNRLLIEIEERQPVAVWQNAGKVTIVSADGKVIDDMRDQRFAGLPFVVGDGANARAAEFARLMEAAGDLRPRIRAGMLVAERRWTLKMTNNVEVKLPERDPAAAVAALAQAQRDWRVLDKDVLSLDLRQPGRIVARLSEEAASLRAESLAKKAKPKGGQT